jgi:hypothetical protein
MSPRMIVIARVRRVVIRPYGRNIIRPNIDIRPCLLRLLGGKGRSVSRNRLLLLVDLLAEYDLRPQIIAIAWSMMVYFYSPAIIIIRLWTVRSKNRGAAGF